MSDSEFNGGVSDEEICSLLESSIRELEDENVMNETATYVMREKCRVPMRGGSREEEEEEEEEGEETEEQLRMKVQRLQGYVRELTEYYRELMEAFEQLKERHGETTVVEEEEEEEENDEEEESEVWIQLRQLQRENEQLRAQAAEGEGERVQEQVTCILRVIDDGVKTGQLKLSELSQYSSELPFPTEDFPLGTQAVSLVRGNRREEEEEGEVREEMERVRGECDELAERLGEAEEKLAVALQQRDQLEAKLQSSKVDGEGLRSEVATLSEELSEAQSRQDELSQALAATRQAMEIYKETARQDLEHRDQELERLRREAESLEERGRSLREECEEGRVRVGGLEEELGKAHDEIRLLQKQVEELVPEAEEESKRVELLERDLQTSREEMETLQQEKLDIEQNLEGRIAELQAGIAAALQGQKEAQQQTTDHRVQLDALRDTQASLQDEVQRCRQLLREKEQQLSRMVSSLHVTAAQIAGLRCHGDRMHLPTTAAVGEGEGEREGVWPSEGVDLVKLVEREVEEVRLEWEESQEAVCRHQTTITKLTVRLEQLEGDIAVRENQVTELEKQVSDVRLSEEGSRVSVQEQEERARELEQEVAEVRGERDRELAAATGNWEEAERLLTEELERRESSLDQLHSENESLQEQLAAVSSEITVMQAARTALQNEFDQLVSELETSQSSVASLEERVHEESDRREGELERSANVVRDLQQQLRTAEEHWKRGQEESRTQHSEEVERLSSEHLQLQEKLREREKMMERLQQEAASLTQQHLEAVTEAKRQQAITTSLQTDLLSTRRQCDSLSNEVATGGVRLEETERQLGKVERERTHLQQQVVDLRGQLEELQESRDQRVREIEREMEQRRQEEAERTEGEKERLVGVVNKQEAELQKFEARLSVVGVEKERLEVKMQSQDDTIASLHKQIDLLRATNAEITSKLSSLEALLAENDDRRHHLQDELAAAEEKQLALEQSRAVLESVGAERLATITLLQSEVEAGRVREEQVGVMAEKLSTLEQLLRTLQEELESAQQENRQLDEAHQTAETLATHIETQLVTERREREGERREKDDTLWQLTQQLQTMKELQTQTRDKLQRVEEERVALLDQIDATEKKERHWSSELTQLTSELQLAREKTAQLEREGAGLKAEFARVTLLLEHTQGELARSQAEGEVAERRGEEGRERVEELEREVREVRREAAGLKGQLAASEESHDHLQHRLSLMEEEYDGLQQTASRAESQLQDTQTNLEDRKVFCQQLQEECDTMTEHVGGWAEKQRSNTELLLQRISDQESQLHTLKASQQELEARNASLLTRNKHLQEQLDRKTQELETAASNEASSSSSLLHSLSSGHPSVTHITATLDLDLTQLAAVTSAATTGTTTAAHHASAIASVPLQFHSQYCSTMEEGLSLVEDSGAMRVGDRGSGEELDKEFWIKRAGQLSVQLQQSSDYWSQKVRELSIQLEKHQQFDNRQTEFSD